MNRDQKTAFVADFRDKVKRAPVMYVTDFTGLDVKSMTQLRRTLKEAGAEYLVVKNRLAKLALEDLGAEELFDSLQGPSGVVLGYEGVVEPAKALADFAKEHEDKPVFKAGFLDDKVLTADEVVRLAKLPPREQLLAELAGAMQAPLAALAGALEAKLQEMAGLLDALKEQKSEGA
ncbi:MAG: 50S ribosomal protein L10 [Gemmatimonadetes bacterium]|nr:MAG: 50S ribosomal protein L10 [Gemmatimonadota bacterium]